MRTADQRLIAKRRAIHAACRELGMEEETRRAMMQQVASVRSTTELNLAGADRVLDHLARAGARLGKRSDVGRRPGKPKATGRDDLLGKIEAQLADMKLPWQYAHSMAHHMFQIQRLDWCDGKQLGKIIAALSYEQTKRGLLAEIDALLKTAGKTRDDVTARIGGDARWQRHIESLKDLVLLIRQWWPAHG